MDTPTVHLPNPQNITHLSVMFQGEFAQSHPNVRFEPTLTPDGERYVALTERVIEIDPATKRTLMFYGYLEYRICEVRYKDRMTHSPIFSSVEVRGYGHEHYIGGKVHFAPHKVEKDDKTLYDEAVLDANAAVAANPKLDPDDEIAYQIGLRCYKKAVALVNDFISGRLTVQP